MDREALWAVGTAVAGMVVWVFTLGRRIGRAEGRIGLAEDKADTMWTFQRRRGYSEAVRNGVVAPPHDSPSIHLTPVWRERLEPLRPEIQEWYRRDDHSRLSNDDLFVELEKAFGDRIVHEICLPYGVHDAACLTAVLLLCRGTHVASRPSPPDGQKP